MDCTEVEAASGIYEVMRRVLGELTEEVEGRQVVERRLVMAIEEVGHGDDDGGGGVEGRILLAEDFNGEGCRACGCESNSDVGEAGVFVVPDMYVQAVGCG